MRNTLLFSTLPFLLSSCVVTGPDYEPPKFEIAEKFQEKLTPPKSTVEKENALWWQNFKDPILDEFVSEAIKENKEVKIALTRINQSRALARAAFTELLPGALLNGYYEKGKNSGARFPGASSTPGGAGFDYEVYGGSIDASWELDIFGRLRRELESRNADQNAQVAELYDTILITISEIGSSYISLRSAQSQFAIAKKNVKLQKNLLNLTKAKFEFGEVGELDLTRAKTQLAQTRSLLPELENTEKTHRRRIAILLGKEPNSLDDILKRKKDIPNYDGPITIGEPQDLLRRRPDIRQAEKTLKSKNALIGVAWGELYPKVTFSGSLGVEAPQFNSLDNNASTYSFGPSISWAALDSGRLMSRVHVAEEQTKEALLTFEQAVLLALEDVENSLSRYSSEQEKLHQLRKAYKASKKSYELARYQYNEGALDFLAVLDTQRTLLETENAYIQSKEYLSTALVGIYKSLGGGWEAWDLQEKIN